ncbi:hypothetical protein Pmani_008843 [Petrolisthes manimaculis]|uniref:Uncharacterized protein n=1 Tax=Petrolisthes manimaculis TaxID=1843537 RepID=A0AAE1Q897_9EUCA|nr:hypothetical protein Pmani_008843 [Petrolisthes manimaculis]
MAGLITGALFLAVCILHLTRALGPSQIDAQLASLNSLTMEDVETNIMLNQLAILKLLNSPRQYEEGECICNEVKHVRTDLLAALQDCQDSLTTFNSTISTECTTIPTTRTDPLSPLSYSIIQMGNNEMVEVDVEIIPPSQEVDVRYSHNIILDHGTTRDGWIHIVNSKTNNDKVVFVCNGEYDGTHGTQYVDWSIPTSVLTAPRHIIIQVQRRHVSLFEKTGDGLKHIASRTCPRPFPSFPYFTVKTQCVDSYCADLLRLTRPLYGRSKEEELVSEIVCLRLGRASLDLGAPLELGLAGWLATRDS